VFLRRFFYAPERWRWFLIKSIYTALFLLVFLQCAVNAPLAAQSCSVGGTLRTQVWYFPDAVPAGWFYAGPYPGTFAYLIGSWSGTCAAPSAWCPTCGKGVAKAADPINLTNGNTYIQQTDVRIPGLGGGLSLQRTWNSIWPASQSAFQTGMFGPNWRSTFEERVFIGTGNYSSYMVYLRADGGFWVFSSPGGSTWNLAAPGSATATLTQSGTQSWTLTFQNGEKRIFDYASGSLTSIVDRNGNTTQLSYDGANRLLTVTDPASRHLNFTYGGPSGNLVTGVSSDVVLALSYAYDPQGRLIQVTKPDQTTISFAYNAQSLITAVTDSNGKTLESHTYDSVGRGATASLALGVDAVTITYPNP
jgi:YD repeat-containing protein